MNSFRVSALLLVLAAVAGAARAADAADLALPVAFNRDIKPILADNCYACHGPDRNARQAELRLDTRGGLFGEATDGRVVVPGSLDDSELWRRITADDPEVHMPPADSGKTLSPRQIETLKAWIEQGAPWQDHWAFLRIERAAVPAADSPGFSHNPIDAFVLAKLAERG